jgi:hypothetical protein
VIDSVSRRAGDADSGDSTPLLPIAEQRARIAVAAPEGLCQRHSRGRVISPSKELAAILGVDHKTLRNAIREGASLLCALDARIPASTINTLALSLPATDE